MRVRNPEQTHSKLLHAAVQIIEHTGVSELTLDGVAALAGISKGGLLHHFPTKQALLEGIVVEVARLFAQRHSDELAAEPPGARGRWARAYIRASFLPDEREAELSGALKVAMTSYVSLARIFVEQFAWTSAPPDDGLPPARLALIRMACDGAWLDEFNAHPLDPASRAALVEELLELTI